MTVTNWNTTIIDGQEYLVVDVAKFRIPLDWDPSSNMFFAVAAPDGGLGNFPALVQGEAGTTPQIDNVIELTELEWDDPTPASASFTETSPDIYQLTLALRKGEPGADGTSELDPDAYGTPVYKHILVVNADADGFEYQAQKVGDRWIPASINNTPSGNAGFTLCSVGVPGQNFDWRPEVEGWSVVTGTGADVQVDLIARLNNETAGNEVGRGHGPAGVNTSGIATTLSSGPPAGSADSYDLVSAGAAATIFLRAERQSGTETFTTSNSTTRFKVRVAPVP